MSSDDLKSALSTTPCGCLLVQSAARRPPEDARHTADAEFGSEMQRRWGCPGAGYEPPGTLDPECLDALQSLSRVTGCEAFARCGTCPLVASDQPWVRRVLRLYHWREKGAATVVAAELADAGMLAALDVLDQALSARTEAEQARRDEEAAEQRKAAERAAMKQRQT